jgi:hypothetical protein
MRAQAGEATTSDRARSVATVPSRVSPASRSRAQSGGERQRVLDPDVVSTVYGVQVIVESNPHVRGVRVTVLGTDV